MVRFDQRTGYLNSTDLGRTASHFYIKYDTIEVRNRQAGRQAGRQTDTKTDRQTGKIENCNTDAVIRRVSTHRRFGNAAFFRVQDRQAGGRAGNQAERQRGRRIE